MVGAYALTIENLIQRLKKIIFLYMDQILERVAGHEFYCFLDGYSSYNQIELHWKIKRRLLSHVHLVLLHIEGCLLDYVMHQPRFKDACSVYLVIWLNVFLKFLWMIFLFLMIHLMIV